MTFKLERLVRRNIRDLKPYSSARSEFVGTAEVFLDANENSFGSPAGPGYNRYPDPLQTTLKARIAPIKQVLPSQIFIGNGSDEAIDLLFRVFCEPGRDEVIICPPTYGMYRVSAEINDVAVREVLLTDDFQLNVAAITRALTERTKLIFVCSPNNPTGDLMRHESMIELAESFDGIIVVDEAYIDFAGDASLTGEIGRIPNLVVLQTFSKAWGMAGIRVGLAYADQSIVDLMNRVKPPYNVSEIAQDAVIRALADRSTIEKWIGDIISERERLQIALDKLQIVKKVYPSSANFILAKFTDANAVYDALIDQKIVVRNRSNVELCDGCLRITVGTATENDRLIATLEMIENTENVPATTASGDVKI